MTREFMIESEGVKFELINGVKSAYIEVFVNGIKFASKCEGLADEQIMRNELFLDVIDAIDNTFQVDDDDMDIIDPKLREITGWRKRD